MSRQCTVIGQQQQSLCVIIEATNCNDTRQCFWQQIKNSWPVMCIRVRGDTARWLVKTEHPGGVRLRHSFAIHSYASQIFQDHRRACQDLPIQGDPPIENHLFHVATGGHASARQQLGDPVAVLYVDLISHRAALAEQAGSCQSRLRGLVGNDQHSAPVVKLVDALDSKSSSERNAGSSPARGTIFSSFEPSQVLAGSDIVRLQRSSIFDQLTCSLSLTQRRVPLCGRPD
jgi:hypothetical protein